MPFVRPTLSELRDQAWQDYVARLPGGDRMLREASNVGVIAAVQAGQIHLVYGFLDWLATQLMADTAERVYLDRWSGIWGVTRKPASAAAGSVTVGGAPGAVLPDDTRLLRADGVEYRVPAGVVVPAGGLVNVAAVAVAPGAAGNAAAGTALSVAAAVPGISARAAVAAGGLSGGADAEADDSLRARLLDRIRQPPMGGAYADYLAWALAVPGVTRAWVFPREMGIGTVTVRVMMDLVRADQQGIPQGTGAPDYSGDLAAVWAALDPLRPAGSQLFVAAPLAVPLAVTVASLSPDTAAVRAAVAAEMADMIVRLAVPGGTIRLSWIWQAVSQATGEISHRIVVPGGDVVLSTGQIAVPGPISYIP